jgi:hypothetical protein
MKKLMWVVMVIALVVVAFETFQPTPAFPAADSSFVTGAVQLLL